jgi:valyl-tRNA synthetase
MAAEEMPKAYEPAAVEESIYKSWEESGFFNPDNLDGPSGRYVNVLPPPNANGELHIGHASGYVVMDLLGRYQRMLGKKVLLLPGKDHAGIQTQVVYEKKIKKERGIGRHDLGREAFYDEVYAFCQDRASYMRNQEKKIGLSADWSREKFTLNPELIDTVLKTFIRMHNEVDNEGNRLAYQGERIINWCPRCFTALADVEVEHEEQAAKLYTFKYDKSFPFAISTTRPETKLGDTAVAVNPDDERYRAYVGQTYEADFCGQPLKIKIIADRNVDSAFGTGALGVTPAHSVVDWEMAREHGLDEVRVIGQDGRILPGFGRFSGLEVSAARAEIAASLKSAGLLEKEDDYQNSLSVCERCKTAIEPLVSKQWFINVDYQNFSLKKQARLAMEKGEIKIYPERFEKVMLNWIDNVRDWCISRQIWWGPRIPAWYKDGQVVASVESPGEGFVQDEDTFDTWFSSGQWAYSTLGYPNGQDFKDYYPSDTMVMGRDILPFWAFRMIILSLYTTGKVPFKKLYFTGLVRDEKGLKMSKSKGNGIEPLEMISRYGTDAVRLSLVIGSAPGNDMNLGEAKIAGFRNFTNKLWNIARYAIANISETELAAEEIELKQDDLSSFDCWIVAKLNQLIGEVEDDLENFRLSQAGERLKAFTWDDLADWYLEALKVENNQSRFLVLRLVLENLLKLWHPFMPFVTEKIWSSMGKKDLLMVAPWPKQLFSDYDLSRGSDFQLAIDLIKAIRNARAENRIEPAKKIEAIICAGKMTNKVLAQAELIKGLKTGLADLTIVPAYQSKGEAIFLAVGELEIYLLGGLDKAKEKERLAKEIAEKERFINNLQNKLANNDFVSHAPAAIIAGERAKLEIAQAELQKLKAKLA